MSSVSADDTDQHGRCGLHFNLFLFNFFPCCDATGENMAYNETLMKFDFFSKKKKVQLRRFHTSKYIYCSWGVHVWKSSTNPFVASGSTLY